MSKAIRWSNEQLDAYLKRQEAPKPPAPDPKKSLQALGRLKDGEMNKTEQRYDDHLKALQMAGEIAWYRFEGIKLKLADNTFLTVDFFVMMANGELQAHDVKGAKAIVQDDSWAKIKIAASMYPFRFFLCFPKPMKQGGGWTIEEV
jgi:hypothetical protein